MLLIPARAKVNLCLAVCGRRPDGFHDIDSVVATIDWHDLVGLRLRHAEATSVRLRVSGSAGDVPAADANLAAAAARAITSVVGPLEIEIWLDKRVPSAAGLGGGSADAAAVLRGCAALLSSGARGTDAASALDPGTLLRLGASLGSDVPALLGGGVQRAGDRGDRLTSLRARPLHLTVAVAGSVGTASAYAALVAHDFEGLTRVDRVIAALARGETPDDDLLGSGLEAAACRASPNLEERLRALRAAVPQARWHLTGSGGAAFALAASADQSAALADAAVAAHFTARACRLLSG